MISEGYPITHPQRPPFTSPKGGFFISEDVGKYPREAISNAVLPSRAEGAAYMKLILLIAGPVALFFIWRKAACTVV